ncbi:Glutathione S-transferase [Nostoc flagelliforme CCNUN1]|uniref:Glutathione S-transferase n=1 Tax=Nostoc flagelliforme CCNUN1 TaxID=2038116 RepID=A0A2K8T344_9NOSO|nr:hypothetical protein [Nostoc flagelliforme]AUB42117.1 Glutathione S-transferase [Nostoc flagelliforme CCNUN1]
MITPQLLSGSLIQVERTTNGLKLNWKNPDNPYPQPTFYPGSRIERLCCRQGEELADNLIDNVVGLWYETRKGNQADFATQAKYQSSINRLLGVFEQKLTNSASGDLTSFQVRSASLR